MDTSEIAARHNVMVPMRDGVHLAVDIYAPGTDGRYPALLAVSPYGKSGMHPGQAVSPDVHPTVEQGHTERLLELGYVHVVGDLRGTGKSEGDFSATNNADDCYDLVEWIARQQWSDGNVGMTGISYFARVQVSTASKRPPHLKAIMPFEPVGADFYRDFAYHGGLLNRQFLTSFHSYVQTPPGHEPFSLSEYSKAELKERVASIRRLPEFDGDEELQAILDDPMRNPSMFDLMLHPEDQDLYRALSWDDDCQDVEIPCYFGMWGNHNMVDAFSGPRAFNDVASDHKKLIFGPPVFPDRPYWQYSDEVRRWYGQWLKGEAHGIEDEPPIRIFVTGENKWKYATEWPLAETRWTRFYLQPDNWIHEYPPRAKASNSRFQYEPGKHGSLFCESATLIEDTEVVGPLSFYLHGASSVDGASWIVTLYDVSPDGHKYFLTRGWLKAAHRSLDLTRSTHWRPYHSHRDPTPIEPGVVYDYAIELMPIAHLFHAGHRLGIEISGDEHALIERGRGWLASLVPTERKLIDELMLERFHTPHAVDRRPKTLTVYHDADHASYLLAPVTSGNVLGTSSFLRPNGGDVPRWLK